jgi:hypothetical protein
MPKFVVDGPFKVPVEKNGQGTRQLKERAQINKALKTEAGAYIARPGCYVFSCAAPKGSIPIYVGKAGKNILKEAFNYHNVTKLNRYLFHKRGGQLELYIIYQERVRVRDRVSALVGNPTAIAEIEEFLLGFAARRNKALINIHGVGQSWHIHGVDQPGKPRAEVKKFKEMMGMKSRSSTAPSNKKDEELSPIEVESETPNTDEVEAIEKQVETSDIAAG